MGPSVHPPGQRRQEQAGQHGKNADGGYGLPGHALRDGQIAGYGRQQADGDEFRRNEARHPHEQGKDRGPMGRTGLKSHHRFLSSFLSYAWVPLVRRPSLPPWPRRRRTARRAGAHGQAADGGTPPRRSAGRWGLARGCPPSTAGRGTRRGRRPTSPRLKPCERDEACACVGLSNRLNTFLEKRGTRRAGTLHRRLRAARRGRFRRRALAGNGGVPRLSPALRRAGQGAGGDGPPDAGPLRFTHRQGGRGVPAFARAASQGASCTLTTRPHSSARRPKPPHRTFPVDDTPASVRTASARGALPHDGLTCPKESAQRPQGTSPVRFFYNPGQEITNTYIE